jgi:tetratricopeptide (TPR) repeat protein
VLTSQYRLDLPMGKVWDWIGLRGLAAEQGIALLRAEGVKGEETDLAAFVEAADGHPLLLTLAVNLLKKREKDDREEPEIVRLGQDGVSMLRGIVELHRGDAEACVGKVLDASFERLYPDWMRVLLWRLSVLRGQFGLEMAQGMIDEPVELADLRRLRRWSFLQEEKLEGQWQFDFLPLIARYLQLGGQDQNQLEIAHERAIDYYIAHFQEWDGTIESCRSELEGFYHCCELGQYGQAKGMLDRCVNQLDRAGYWRELRELYGQLTQDWQPEDDTAANNLGVAWTRLGNLQRRLGEVALSIDSHHQAQARFEALDFPEGQAAALGNLGNAYHSLGDYQRAIDFYSQCLEVMQAIGDKRGIANSLSGLGSAYYSLGDYQRAIELYSQHRELAEAIGDKGGVANSLSGLGNAYQSLGDYQRAIEFHSQSLEIEQAIGNKSGVAASLGSLGNAYQSLGGYQRAIEFHSQHRELAEAIGDKRGVAASLSGLGIAYRSLGDYQRAIEFHSQSLEIKEAIGDKGGVANSLSGLGNAYHSLGDYQRAIDFHSQHRELAEAIGNKAGVAASLGNLGNAYCSLGDYQRAIEFHSQYREMAEVIGDKGGVANSLGNLGNAYQSLGDYQRAIEFQSQSLEIKQAIGNKGGVASSSISLAGIYQQRGRFKLAMKYRHQAYRTWKEMNLPVAALPFPEFQKRMLQNMGDDWAAQLITSEQSMGWFMILSGVLIFAIRQLLSPLTFIQKRLKIKPLWFWLFTAGLGLVLLIAWLRR